jgi:hypothetical protein|nr:MAG TPA: hypothetical protein [Caudoviricetes sp.]
MDKDNLYKDRRWTDIPKATVTGHKELSKEEREASKKKLRNHLKKIGIIKEED